MSLSELRAEIDGLDEEILALLSKRFALALRTRQYKTQIEDTSREAELLRAVQQKAERFSLDADFTHKLYACILTESKRLQNEIT